MAGFSSTVGSGSYSFEISNPIKIVSAPIIYRNKITGQTEITCADSGCEIHYTTDGSQPNINSPKYDKAFNQVTAAIIRAKTFSADGLESVETKAVLNQLSVSPPNIIPDQMLVEEPGHAEIEIKPQTPGAEVYYTLDGSNPTEESTLYKNPILVNQQTTVKAVAMKKAGHQVRLLNKLYFLHFREKQFKIEGGVDPRYSGGGEDALIDNKRGTVNYKDSTWQGFEGRDLQADIDLGKSVDVKQVTIGFLQDQNSWIFLPEEVEVFYSKNDKDFIPLKKMVLNAKEPSKLKQIKNVTIEF